MGSDPYAYSTLQNDKHIRLLRLLPSTNLSSRLEACLFEYPLCQVGQQAHLYEALSYTWGAPEKNHTILIDKKDLLITPNCHAALLQLRDCFIERILWVDAICIDQSSKEERGKQVQLMAEVYCKARQVIVWLGEGRPETDDAIDRIRAAAEGDNVSAKQGMPQSVMCLLERPWFRRVWILQEVAAAQHIVMLCGESQIDGYAFCLGLSSFIDLYESSPVISSVEYLIRGSIFRPKYSHTPSGSVTLRIRPLGELMDMYQVHEATEPLDKVFALLGMSTDGFSAPELTPDYSISWDVLFSRLITFLLGAEVTATTSNIHKTAVISGNGIVIGKVASVAPRRNKNRDYQVTMTFSEPFETLWSSSTWNLQAGVKGVQEDDILCLLNGASKPILIRQRGDLLSIIMISASTPQQQAALPRLSASREFVLTWDLEEETRNPKVNQVAKWTDESILECTEPHLAEPVRRGNLARGVANILSDAGQFEKSAEIFEKSIAYYSTTLSEQDRTRVECLAELAVVYGSFQEWQKAKTLLEFVIRTSYTNDYEFSQIIDFLTELLFVLKIGGYVYEDRKWQAVQHVLQWKQYGIPIDHDRTLEMMEFLDAEVISILIDQQGHESIASEQMMSAAARNEEYGVQVTKALLERLDDLYVTESVFIAATGNHSSGQEVPEMLLQQGGGDAPITQNVVKSAAGNSQRNKTLVPLLLIHQGIEVSLDEVTDEAWATLASFMRSRLSPKRMEKGKEREITITISTEDEGSRETKKENEGEIDPEEVETGVEADEETLAFIRAFSKINQITALRTILSAADPKILFPARRELYRAAFEAQNWEYLEDIFQIIPPSVEDIISTLVNILMSDDKRAANRLLEIAKRGNVGPGKENTVAKEVVSGCSKLIETQTPTELARFLDYVYHLRISFTRQHKGDALPTQSAILPAAVSRDQQFIETLVQRNIVSVRMRPFIVPTFVREIGDRFTEKLIDHGYQDERFPSEGMPDWPLYCAIGFTFDPQSIAFLCRAGARIDADSKDPRKPAIIIRLERNPTLQDARRDYMNL